MPKFTRGEVAFMLLLGTVVAVVMAFVGVPTYLFGVVGGLIGATVMMVADEIRQRRQTR